MAKPRKKLALKTKPAKPAEPTPPTFGGNMHAGETLDERKARNNV